MSEAATKQLDKERLEEIKEAKEKNEKLVVHERDPVHREEVKNVPSFQCVNCLTKFDFDLEKGDPSCSKCGSTEVIPLRPKVRFIAVPDPVAA